MALGGIFIGKPHITQKKELTDGGPAVAFNPCFQIQMHAMPVPAGPGKVAMQREITCLPFITTLREAAVWIRPGVTLFMDDLQPADQARYKTLVDQARKLQEQLRAQDAGLSLADRMPGKPPGHAC